jgi:hypothetical protein
VTACHFPLEDGRVGTPIVLRVGAERSPIS